MKYFDHQHHILKYLCKLRYGLTSAHLKCVEEGTTISKDKLREHMAGREIMTKEEFDIALDALVKDGYIDEHFMLTQAGKDENVRIFKEHYSSPEFLAEAGGIDTSKLLFNEK